MTDREKPFCYVYKENGEQFFAPKDGYYPADATPLYTHPPQRTEQEPVAWMFQHDETNRMNYVSNDGIHNPTTFLEMNPRYLLVCPLFTPPPQRPWVDLTDTQIEQVYFEMVQEHRGAPMPWGQVQFGKALLEKFREVNQ